MEKRIKIDFEKTFKNNSRREDINFRKLYLKKFLKDGFPSKKLENWKFSDLNQIINNHIGGLNFYNNF